MNVNFYANFRSLVGGKTVDVPLPDGSDVAALVQCLVEQYPVLRGKLLDEDGELASHIHIFVNGRDTPYLPDALQTTLSADDQIDIFPPVAGG